MSLEQRRERFRMDRESQSDAAFLAATDSDTSPELLLSVRRAMAAVCQVPAEMVHASDTPRDLSRLMSDGGDLTDFVFALEDELATRDLTITRDIPDLPLFGGWRFFFWDDEGLRTFGEWALVVVAMLHDQDLVSPAQ